MRINDILGNIQNNTSTGINNDLSLVDGVYPDKNKATAPGEKTPGAVGFFRIIKLFEGLIILKVGSSQGLGIHGWK